MIWVNDDKSPHTVTDKGRVFRSAALDTEDRFSYTFATPGEFTYFCTLAPDDGRQDRRQAGRHVLLGKYEAAAGSLPPRPVGARY